MLASSLQWRQRLWRVFVCTMLMALPLTAAAQNITGQITGRVTDSSGGTLPGVSVTVVNENTGLSVTRVTDATGVYVFTNLPVGSYSVAAELEGFRKVQRTGFQLGADGRVSADFSLTVGGLQESVEVTAVMGETVNRTSGEVARTIDSQQIKDLAFNGRNYLELASLIPGAVATDYDPLALATSLSVTGQSINGNRGNTNNLTVDGGSNLDSGSNGSQVNNVSLTFIDQVKIQTSNFSAELGRNSGAAINVVTRSGTNRFSGSGRYDLRDEAFDEPNYFAARDAAGNRTKPELEFRNIEAGIGGPIVKNKLFFFGGQQYRTINRFTSPARQTMPTSAELNGDFAFRLRGTDGIVGTADDGVLRDPVSNTPFPGNRIPAQSDYDRRPRHRQHLQPDDRARVGVHGLDHCQQRDLPALQPVRTAAGHHPHRLAGDRQAAHLRPLPARRVRPARSLRRLLRRAAADGADQPVASRHELPRRPHLRAQFQPDQRSKVTAAWNGQRINPQGDTWQRDTYGYQFPELFPGGFITDGIPTVRVGGFPNLISPSFALLSPTTDITFQNTLTYTRGQHSVRSGFAVSRNRKDQNGRAAYLGDVTFNTSGNPNSTSNALADALLGNFRSYNEASADPVGFFRFTAYQGFVSDSWRVKPNLSLELGLRYEYVQPTYAQGNNLVNFDPGLYDPSQAVTVLTSGLLVPNSGNRFNGLIVAGDGVPEDQQGRVELLTGGDYSRIPFGAPRGLYNAQHLWMPRLSMAYSINPETVLRGGVGLFYDKPEGNVIFSQLNIPPVLDNVTYENFNLSSPSSGAAGAIGALGNISALDPNMELPSQLNYSVGIQRELGGYFVEASYIGNRGEHLIRQPDINRASFDDLRANAALPAAQRVSPNYLRPYKGFSEIRMRMSDADSEYNSLQLYATKRRGQFQFTVSYTLGKVTTNASGNGDNDAPEAAGDLEYTRGPASFDRRHALVNTFTYRPPFWLDRSDILGADPRRLGAERQDALPVRPVLHRDRRLLDRQPPGELHRRRYLNRRCGRGALVQHRRVHGAGGGRPRHGDGRPDPGAELLPVGPVAAQELPPLRAVPLHADLRRLQRLQSRELRRPEHQRVSGAYGTINAAQPSRQFQFGMRLDF